MVPLAEQIPDRLRLIRRPTRDEREEGHAEIVDEDGRVLALVERVDPDSLPN